MPCYDLHCPACDHRYEDFAPMALRFTLRCPRCGDKVENDWSSQRAPAVEKDWHGSKARSIGLLITDEERDEVLRECPSVEVNKAGQLISHNRGHHRNQMKELSAYQKRLVQKDAPAREAKKRAEDAEKAERLKSLKEIARDTLRRRRQQLKRI